MKIKNSAMAFLVAPLALLSILLTQLQISGYPMLTFEAGLAIAGITIIGTIIGGIVIFSPQVLRNAIFALIVAMVANGLFRPFTALSWLGLSETVYPVAISGIAFTTFFLLSEKTNEFLATISGAVLLSSLLVSAQESDWRTMVNRSMPAGTNNLSPYIHIVLDGHIGLGGIPDEFDPTGRFRDTVLNNYLRNDFRVYSDVNVSTPPQTVVSFRDFLGFDDMHITDRFEQFSDQGSNPLGGPNRLFEMLHEMGYSLNVIQSTHLDLCNEPDAQRVIDYCRTYPYSPFLDTLIGSSLGPKDKAIVMMNVVFRRSGIAKVIDILAESGTGQWLHLPTWPLFVCQYCIAAETALTEFDRSIPKIDKGDAYFIHLTSPHDPYQFYDENCGFDFPIRYQTGSIANNYARYLGQSVCIQSRLMESLEMLADQPHIRDAIVIIHSDHGPPAYALNTRRVTFDPESSSFGQAAYSVFFAVKAPGLRAGRDETTYNLPALLKSTVQSQVVRQSAD